MKTLFALILLSITLNFDGLGQINIRTRRSVPTNYSSVIDADAISNAITTRVNSFNSNVNSVQSWINELLEKSGDLQNVNKKRYRDIKLSINSFTDFLNENHIDYSNSTNKRYVDNDLNEINNAIDAAFENGDENIKIPIWIDLEDGKGKQKVSLYSAPK